MAPITSTPCGASWSVNAKTGATVYERNAERMFAPASVTKLFTCAAALDRPRRGSTAETVVFQRGPVVNGTLRGDLILVAAGDLTFGGRTKDGKTVFKDKDHTYANSGLTDSELTDTDPLAGLNDLAKQIKDAGINADRRRSADRRSLFDRGRGSGSGPDAVSPIMVNDNVIDILIEPGAKAGDPAKVTTRPETGFFQVDAAGHDRDREVAGVDSARYPSARTSSRFAARCRLGEGRRCASIRSRNRRCSPARCSSRRCGAMVSGPPQPSYGQRRSASRAGWL